MKTALKSTPRKAVTREQAGLFGWQGIALERPEDWELTAFGGDVEQGHAYLDNGEQMCLRIRWETPRYLYGLDAAMRRYRRAVRRESNMKMVFEQQDPAVYPIEFGANKELRPFTWNGGEAAFGIAWRCKECNRIVIADVVAPVTARQQRTGRRVLATITDHADAGDTVLWAVYGFAFRTATIYNLDKALLETGRLRFAFRGPAQTWLRVERWGMATHALKKAPLDAWPEELLRMLKVRRTGNLASDKITWQGHAAYRFSAHAAQKGIKQLVSPPTPVEGVVWHDEERDKVLVVVAGGDTASDTVDCVAETVRCSR